MSPSDSVRYAQQFYPQYAQQHTVVGSSTMPTIHDSMTSMRPATTLSAAMSSSARTDNDGDARVLFGGVPEAKRRKFILVDDTQRDSRVRVRVTLDQVKMDDMPDGHLRNNAVYPRSYYSRQMSSPSGSPRSSGRWDDDDDSFAGIGRGKSFVPVKLVDGREEQLPIPRMTKSRRSKEAALNEIGYRMCWGQPRTFNQRTLFLQRSRKYRGYRLAPRLICSS